MLSITGNKPPWWFWMVSMALLLWSLGGASIYLGYFLEEPREFAGTAETKENAQAYAEYIANIPVWAITIGISAAVTRLLGAVCLLLRRAWALPLFVGSMVFFMVALYRAFVLAHVASVMSRPHVAVEAVFLALSVFAVWFARVSQSRGILK